MAVRSLLPGVRRGDGEQHPGAAVEFTRKGRFDELYGVYLPTHAERQEIFGIHLKLAAVSDSSST